MMNGKSARILLLMAIALNTLIAVLLPPLSSEFHMGPVDGRRIPVLFDGDVEDTLCKSISNTAVPPIECPSIAILSLSISMRVFFK